MRLKAINDNTEKYGYPQIMEYDNPNFNGHQIGVAICVKNNNTGIIEKNFLSETLGDEQTRDFLLSELIREDSGITLLSNIISQFNEDRRDIELKTVYYLPYIVENHSRFQPTVIDNNISEACNVGHDIKVEIVFAEDEDGLNRYITIPFGTRNVSVMDLVYDLFQEESLEELEKIGIKWQEASELEDAGYVLDFYNEVGDRTDLVFSTPERLRDTIVSMRLIEIVSYIDVPDAEEVKEDGEKENISAYSEGNS